MLRGYNLTNIPGNSRIENECAALEAVSVIKINLITILFQPTLKVALALAAYEPKHTPSGAACLPGQSYGQNGIETLPDNEKYASC